MVHIVASLGEIVGDAPYLHDRLSLLRLGGRRGAEAPLTIGAGGHDSLIAELSGVKVRTYPQGRFAYGGYFEGVAPMGAAALNLPIELGCAP